MSKPSLKAVPKERDLLREFEQKKLEDLKIALQNYWELLDLKWLSMVQPLVSMAVKYGAATTPDQMILLESLYKDQLSSALGKRAEYSALHIKEALHAIAIGYGWHVVDDPPAVPRKRRK